MLIAKPVPYIVVPLIYCSFIINTYSLQVVNGSNLWLLCQPDQVNKTDPWPGGHKVLFAAASRLPNHQPNKERRGTDSSFALIGVIIVPYWWLMPDDWLLLNPPQVKHLWFQQKQVEADSQSVTEHFIDNGIYTLYPVWGIGDKWQQSLAIISANLTRSIKLIHGQ